MTTRSELGGTDQEFQYGYGGVNLGQHLLTWQHGTSIQRSPLGEAFTVDADQNAVSFLRGPNGKALAYRIDGQNAYLVPDRLGSTIGVMNDSGAVVVSYAYDPYGSDRSAPGLDIFLAWANIVTYIGAMRDLQTGLYRIGVRWYDPNTGRFTTPDPTSQKTNPYTYATANPCNNTDPTGANSCAASDYTIAGGGSIAGFAGILVGGLTVGFGMGLTAIVAGFSTIAAAAASLDKCSKS